jgi:two-component sensor histidine kinase/integral membrane sensor domain MASE1
MLQSSSAVGKGDPSDIGMIRRWASGIALAAAVSVGYFLAAQLSLRLLVQPDGVAVFWLSGGITSGVLIALGPRARWPVAAGAVAGDLVPSLLSGWAAVAVGLCNAAEALIAAGLIQYYFGTSFTLSRLRSVVGFLVAAAVATMISGVGGAIVYKLSATPTAPILTIWWHWFASDALGIISLAPLVIGVTAAMREPPPRNELIEGGTALALLTGMTGIIISLPSQPWETVVPSALLFPMLLWLAARCRPVFAAAGAFIVAFAVVWTTIFGIGHFGDPGLPIADRILQAQAVIMVVTVGSFVLAALFAERRQQAVVVAESEKRLQEALAVGSVIAFDWDVSTDLVRRSQNAAQLLGYDPQQTFDNTSFVSRIHPDDLGRIKEMWSNLNPNTPSASIRYRYLHPDRCEMWFQEISKGEFDAAGRLVRLGGLALDITEPKRAEDHQKILMAELDHRVKNVLARVAAVADSTRQGDGSIDEFIRSYNGRIQSMAAAHTLLSESGWRGTDLSALVRSQLAPFGADANIAIVGIDIMLGAPATQALAMVLHELVTNAVKYGALSIPDGRVSVSWERKLNGSAAANLILVWREAGGPPVASEIRSGYGAALIRELIPHELGGNVDLVFASDGACCIIEFPLL